MKDPAFRTVLVPDRQSLVGPLGCSVVFHVGTVLVALAARGVFGVLMAVVVAIFPWCAAQEQPIIVDSLEVAVVSLPKSDTKMPDRATQAPKQVGSKPEPVEEAAPVKESDLVVKDPEPPPDPGNSEEVATQPSDRDLELQRLVNETLTAPEGAVDQAATSPEGTGDLALASLSAESMGDPDYARWRVQIEHLYREKFNALGNTAGLVAVGSVTVDPATGRVLKNRLSKPSGTLAFDSAAERAMATITRIPLPPEKYRPLLQSPIPIEFATD